MVIILHAADAQYRITWPGEHHNPSQQPSPTASSDSDVVEVVQSWAAMFPAILAWRELSQAVMTNDLATVVKPVLRNSCSAALLLPKM